MPGNMQHAYTSDALNAHSRKEELSHFTKEETGSVRLGNLLKFMS